MVHSLGVTSFPMSATWKRWAGEGGERIHHLVSLIKTHRGRGVENLSTAHQLVLGHSCGYVVKIPLEGLAVQALSQGSPGGHVTEVTDPLLEGLVPAPETVVVEEPVVVHPDLGNTQGVVGKHVDVRPRENGIGTRLYSSTLPPGIGAPGPEYVANPGDEGKDGRTTRLYLEHGTTSMDPPHIH